MTAEFVFAGEYLAAVSAGELARAVDVLHVSPEVGHDGLGADGTHPAPGCGQLRHGYCGAWNTVFRLNVHFVMQAKKQVLYISFRN